MSGLAFRLRKAMVMSCVSRGVRLRVVILGCWRWEVEGLLGWFGSGGELGVYVCGCWMGAMVGCCGFRFGKGAEGERVGWVEVKADLGLGLVTFATEQI